MRLFDTPGKPCQILHALAHSGTAAQVRGLAQWYSSHPQQPSGDDQQQGDALSAAHESEQFTAPGVAAEELDEVAAYAVNDEIGADDLAFELLAPQQPNQKNAVCELERKLIELRRMQRYAQRRAYNLSGQRILEGHGPGDVGLASPAATGGEAADAAEGVSQSQPGGEHVAGGQHGQVVAPHVPHAHEDCQHQSA